MAEFSTIEYDERQRDLFRSGDLAAKWYAAYPDIFDKQDFEIASNQPQYHFFEWLGAIVLYHSLGFLSLVEQYEFTNHERKQRALNKILPEKVLSLVLNHEQGFGNIQCPDLLVYAPDYSDWFFCEAKGPTDKIRDNQTEFFEALRKASNRPVRIIRFKRYASSK